MHNRIPAIFSSPLGVLKGEGGRGDVNMGLGTKGKGESSAGGSGKDKRLPDGKRFPTAVLGKLGLVSSFVPCSPHTQPSVQLN